jgi:positive regulator of sigma E activity
VFAKELMSDNNEFITETGVVNKIKGKLYYVKLSKTEKCEGCKICDFGKNNSITVPALSDVECNVEDKVIIRSPIKKTYLSSIIMYLLPIVVMLVCAIISYNITGNDLTVLITCVIGLVFSFIIVFILDKLIRNKNNMPLIIKNLSK